jgi:hypothetical protein
VPRQTTSTRRISVLALLAAAAIGLVGCSQLDPVVSTTTGPPSAAECSASLSASIGCDAYRSVAATEAGIDVAWVRDSAIGLGAQMLGDTPTVVVTTPCNVLNIPVALDGDVLEPGSIVATTKGCDPERAAQEGWVRDFFRSDVRWERTGTSLILHAENATLDLDAA